MQIDPAPIGGKILWKLIVMPISRRGDELLIAGTAELRAHPMLPRPHKHGVFKRRRANAPAVDRDLGAWIAHVHLKRAHVPTRFLEVYARSRVLLPVLLVLRTDQVQPEGQVLGRGRVVADPL
jgi:hypothetical protein